MGFLKVLELTSQIRRVSWYCCCFSSLNYADGDDAIGIFKAVLVTIGFMESRTDSSYGLVDQLFQDYHQ